MPSLQVRDLPQDIYEALVLVAHAENRSLAQQTVVMLRTALDLKESRQARRRAVLEEIASRPPLPGIENFPSAADLIREDRDR
jgi:plasmid stability protein